jgi:hypothetical protein
MIMKGFVRSVAMALSHLSNQKETDSFTSPYSSFNLTFLVFLFIDAISF